MALVSIRNLNKVYDGGVHAVKDVNLEIRDKEFMVFVGPSGCGKTTTLRCIAGLEQPDQGAIRLGSDVLFDAATGANIPLNRRNIGMVFQSYAIWPHMTVFENLAFGLKMRKYEKAEIQKRK